MKTILRVLLCVYYTTFVLRLTLLQHNSLALPGWIVLGVFCITIAALIFMSLRYLVALAVIGNIGYLAVSLFLIGQMTLHDGLSWLPRDGQLLLWPFSVISCVLCIVLFVTTDSALLPSSTSNDRWRSP